MAHNCPVCGFEVQDTDKHCSSCGTPNEAAVQAEAPAENYAYPPQQVNYGYTPQQVDYNYNTADNTQQVPPAGLGVGSFFGLNILFNIPFIGFIFSIVMSFAPQNKTLKNFARSYLLWYIIAAVVIGGIFAFVFLVLGASTGILEEIFEEIFYVFEDILYEFI